MKIIYKLIFLSIGLLTICFSENAIEKWKKSSYQPTPVLFIHGIMANQSSWDETANKLKNITKFYKNFKDNSDPKQATIYFDRVDYGGEQVPDYDFYGNRIEASEKTQSTYYQDIDEYWPKDSNGKPSEETFFGSFRSLEHSAYILKNKIDNALYYYGTSKVIIVGHSQGGLVTRALFKIFPEYKNKVERYITLGTPHLGAIFTYYTRPVFDTIYFGAKLYALLFSSISSPFNSKSFKEAFIDYKNSFIDKLNTIGIGILGFYYYKMKGEEDLRLPNRGGFYQMSVQAMEKWQIGEIMPFNKMVFNYSYMDFIASIPFGAESQKGETLNYFKTDSVTKKEKNIEIRPQLEKLPSLTVHTSESSNYMQILKSLNGIKCFDSLAKYYEYNFYSSSAFSDRTKIEYDGKICTPSYSSSNPVEFELKNITDNNLREIDLPWISVSEAGMDIELKVKIRDLYPASDSETFGSDFKFQPLKIEILTAYSRRLIQPDSTAFKPYTNVYSYNDPNGIICKASLKLAAIDTFKYIFVKVKVTNHSGLTNITPTYVFLGYNGKIILDTLLGMCERNLGPFGYSVKVGLKDINLSGYVGKSKLPPSSKIINGFDLKKIIFPNLGYIYLSTYSLDGKPVDWNEYAIVSSYLNCRNRIEGIRNFIKKLKYLRIVFDKVWKDDFLAKIGVGESISTNSTAGVKNYYVDFRFPDVNFKNDAVDKAISSPPLKSTAFKSLRKGLLKDIVFPGSCTGETSFRTIGEVSWIDVLSSMYTSVSVLVDYSVSIKEEDERIICYYSHDSSPYYVITRHLTKWEFSAPKKLKQFNGSYKIRVRSETLNNEEIDYYLTNQTDISWNPSGIALMGPLLLNASKSIQNNFVVRIFSQARNEARSISGDLIQGASLKNDIQVGFVDNDIIIGIYTFNINYDHPVFSGGVNLNSDWAIAEVVAAPEFKYCK